MPLSGSVSTQRSSAPQTTATPRNVARMPTALVSTPPTNGPAMIPIVAAAWAYPTASPRRSAGARAATQASPPPHTAASAPPCSSRAATSSANEPASASPTVDPASAIVPRAVTRRAPQRSARCPTGTATTTTATLNAASIQPTCSVVRSSWRR